MPVKYLSSLFPADVSPQEASRIDSMYSTGDTIYFLGSDLKDLHTYHSLSRQEAVEVIDAINALAKKGNPDKLECSKQNSSSRADDLSISFSQPVFTKDMQKCLMKYEIMSIENNGVEPYRSRETLFLKYEGGKWIDLQVRSLQIMEVRD